MLFCCHQGDQAESRSRVSIETLAEVPNLQLLLSQCQQQLVGLDTCESRAPLKATVHIATYCRRPMHS